MKMTGAEPQKQRSRPRVAYRRGLFIIRCPFAQWNIAYTCGGIRAANDFETR